MVRAGRYIRLSLAIAIAIAGVDGFVTDPSDADTDDDGVQDGTELGVTAPVADACAGGREAGGVTTASAGVAARTAVLNRMGRAWAHDSARAQEPHHAKSDNKH